MRDPGFLIRGRDIRQSLDAVVRAYRDLYGRDVTRTKLVTTYISEGVARDQRRLRLRPK